MSIQTNKGASNIWLFGEVIFQIDTWNMYGSSSVDLHFTGSTHAAALLLIRSIVQTRQSNRGKLIVKATPIALGMGFMQKRDKTPKIALQREAEAYSDDARLD